MRMGLAILALCLAISPVTAEEALEREAMTDAPKIERMGVYVVVDDVTNAAEFYRKLFGVEPEFSSPVFVSFNIASGQFALASKSVFASESKVGDNGVPNIKVSDIDAMFAHVREVAPESLLADHVNREGPIHLFKLRDPDGNMVEFYSVASAAGSSAKD